MSDPGADVVRALAAKDTAGLLAVLSPAVEFRGMTPGRFWEASTADPTVHEVLYRWFEPADVGRRRPDRPDARRVRRLPPHPVTCRHPEEHR